MKGCLSSWKENFNVNKISQVSEGDSQVSWFFYNQLLNELKCNFVNLSIHSQQKNWNYVISYTFDSFKFLSYETPTRFCQSCFKSREFFELDEYNNPRYEVSIAATDLRTNRLYIRIYILWLNLIIQVKICWHFYTYILSI